MLSQSDHHWLYYAMVKRPRRPSDMHRPAADERENLKSSSGLIGSIGSNVFEENPPTVEAAERCRMVQPNGWPPTDQNKAAK